jgi:hypothetical protein
VQDLRPCADQEAHRHYAFSLGSNPSFNTDIIGDIQDHGQGTRILGTFFPVSGVSRTEPTAKKVAMSAEIISNSLGN